MQLYLGLDCSTQSLTAIVIAVDGASRQIVFQDSIDYDAVLPQYGTKNGVLPTNDARVAHSSPLMWAEALDLMLGRIAASGLDLSRLRAIAGAGQQHGSVYLNDRAPARLRRLEPATSLASQIGDILSRLTSPIWMDSSTSAECAEITEAMGGAARLASLTGSRAFERFTAAQIRKFFKDDPGAYRATARIHLVSSFMASLLLGAQAPVDPGDASGMNLMALETAAWLPGALDATAPDLAGKLPAIVPATSVIGRLAPYWQARHRLPAAHIVVWTGDNPSSMIGTGLVREGRIGVSLGTSDTVFGPMREARTDAGGTGHVFGAPTSQFMSLTCFRNGSLARERVRDAYGLDWKGFSTALASTPPGNRGAMMLPWFEPEITPTVLAPGVHRRGLDTDDVAANVRAVVEAQMMAMANHSAWTGERCDTIYATGGASANRELLQVMADVFNASVYQFRVDNAACLGAALRAWHADAIASGDPVGWDEIVRGLAEPVAESRVMLRPDAAHQYEGLLRRYAAFETEKRGG
jgi:xylulokinase